MDKWHDPYWEGVIRLAIQYCRDANRPHPIERAVVSAQIVLELLAYAILVENGRTLTRQQYRAQDADSIFVALLTQLRIPTTVPAACHALTATARREGWDTGPRAVTALRNSVIHPKRNRPQLDNPARIDIWKLSVWYVELALLSFFGYNGTYRNRLQSQQMVGSVDKVPWA